MQIKNNNSSYGVLSIFIHWTMAIMVILLFFLGYYMVDLDYYDEFYNLAPWIHKSIGLIVFFMLSIRLVLRLTNKPPKFLVTYKKWEVVLAKITHTLFYILLFIICISGYFIATSKNSGVEFFNFFEIPAIITLDEFSADKVGNAHKFSAYIIMSLVVIHILASLKHHFFDKDITLTRMFKIKNKIEVKQNEN
jgi:cytochrome b561